MEKIFKLIAVVVLKVDNVLYKTFGLVSPFRRHSWALSGKRLQRDLDREHATRDYLNYLYGTSYTTKQALALQKD
jgi:hypothetical protein